MTARTVHLLVPYWGSPALLDALVASIREQDDPHWTLTIVDDCYPDPTAGERYAADPDARVTYLRNESNLGTTGNFERCRRLATERRSHDLTVFVGSDDLLDPHFVRRVREVHSLFPDAAMVQAGVRVIDADGSPAQPLADRVKAWLTPSVQGPTVLRGQRLASSLLVGNWLYWPAIAFRTEVLADVSFREDLPIVLDLALILDLVLRGESLVLDPVVSFSYRRHDLSASSASRFDRRFADEARFHDEVAGRLSALGWQRARRSARVRATSRMHALSLLPAVLRTRSWSAVRELAGHAAGR